MEPRRIIWRVYHTISLLHTGRLFRHIHWRGDMDIAPLFDVIITTPSPPPSYPPPTLVFWRTPPVGSYKINTDGCVKDGVASGGGIIRDSSGQCIRAFFSFYGDCTILEAELRAILDGIILAQRLGLSVLWVESDSTLAIHCITKGGGPWNIQATLRHIRHLLALDRDTITHIFREGNQAADLLASEGWDRRYYYEYSSQDLPRRHRSLVQIDRFGLPTIRGL
ncbi:RNase H domain-containing protein [Abeliophyllum distichum]|uniref:RNase H domain-containing protein n=1 Tax=Abeliophyllum distichum TaxID=126358 RepID=A0ABD1SX56_9LAMI